MLYSRTLTFVDLFKLNWNAADVTCYATAWINTLITGVFDFSPMQPKIVSLSQLTSIRFDRSVP